MAFSYSIFPVKKINMEEILKLRENCYLVILSINILKLEISGCHTSPTVQCALLPNWIGFVL
jgi:hypothetical protein